MPEPVFVKETVPDPLVMTPANVEVPVEVFVVNAAEPATLVVIVLPAAPLKSAEARAVAVQIERSRRERHAAAAQSTSVAQLQCAAADRRAARVGVRAAQGERVGAEFAHADGRRAHRSR